VAGNPALDQRATDSPCLLDGEVGMAVGIPTLLDGVDFTLQECETLIEMLDRNPTFDYDIEPLILLMDKGRRLWQDFDQNVEVDTLISQMEVLRVTALDLLAELEKLRTVFLKFRGLHEA
jgi:hypothetical protein